MPTISLVTAKDKAARLDKLTAEVKEIQRTLNSTDRETHFFTKQQPTP